VDAGELWRIGQRGWPARYPLVQFPNAPLALGLAGSLAASLLDGASRDVARVVSVAGLVVWALLEVTRGDNAFRRLLGAGFLTYTVVRAASGS
jgi:hypothetical protein